MKRLPRELYGSLILFFYFFKWPYALGFPFLYMRGLDNNIILDFLWLVTVALICKDFYFLFFKKIMKAIKKDKIDT